MHCKPTYVLLTVSEKAHTFLTGFCGAFCGKTMYPIAKASERTNRNMPAKNMLVQLLALYTDYESHNAQHHRQTDGPTEDRIMPNAYSRSYCLAVRSVKKYF